MVFSTTPLPRRQSRAAPGSPAPSAAGRRGTRTAAVTLVRDLARREAPRRLLWLPVALAMGIASMTALANASGALDGALNHLIGLVEAYPELKANQNALQLQEELASTENRIAFARQGYNDAVMRLNESIVVFPSNIVANAFGVREMGLFEASGAERAAVAVRF